MIQILSSTPFLAMRKYEPGNLHSLFSLIPSSLKPKRVYFWRTDHSMRGRMAEGRSSKNLVGQHLAPKQLNEDSTACVFSLSSPAFVLCHQEMQQTFVTSSSSETLTFLPPRVQIRTSDTKGPILQTSRIFVQCLSDRLEAGQADFGK